jgi:acetylornithine deacetylase
MDRQSAVRAVTEYVHASRDVLLRDLADLVGEPTEGGTSAELSIQHRLAERWDATDLEVSTWEIDIASLERDDPDFPGQEVPRTTGLGVLGRLPGTNPTNGKTLLLNLHTDVVPPGDLASWSARPYEATSRVIDGREHMIGRGTCDMKAGAMAAMYAAQALLHSGIPLNGDLLLAPVSGEEDGGVGTYSLVRELARRGVRPDACVIPEPTNLDVVPANGGALTFRLTVHGQATHASRRTEGVSAIERFFPLLQGLRELETARNAEVDPLMTRWPVAYPISIGTVHSGDWASTVPDLLVAEGRYGVALGEDVGTARAAFEAAVRRVCAADPWLRDHPVEVTWWGGQFASGTVIPGQTEALIAAVKAAHSTAGGRDQEVYGAPYGSDLRLLSGLGGIPTVQYGPGDAGVAHSADERVATDDVVTAAAALAVLAIDTCGLA